MTTPNRLPYGSQLVVRKGGGLLMAATHVCQVLIVEDDAMIRALVRDVLGEEGYRITAVATVAAAEAALADTAFDLVLTDYFGSSPYDPRDDRWATLDRLCALAGATPVVLFSAHTPGVFAGYQVHGIDDLLPKPFEISDLLAAVERNLADDCEVEQAAA